MDVEFDTVARWTEQVVRRLGDEYAIPAACRGSASPAALDWLVTASRLQPRTWLADVGGGIGGPAAYARERAGVRPLVLDPMPGACHAATRMFGLDAAVGAGERLPLSDGVVGAVWCLGVLCTMDDKEALLSELRRVLVLRGALGLLVFTADESHPSGAPAGNAFPSLVGTRDLLDGAGFAVEATAVVADLPAPDADWADRSERFSDELRRTYGDDSRFADAEDQSARMGELMESGRVTGHLLAATRRAPTDRHFRQ